MDLSKSLLRGRVLITLSTTDINISWDSSHHTCSASTYPIIKLQAISFFAHRISLGNISSNLFKYFSWNSFSHASKSSRDSSRRVFNLSSKFSKSLFNIFESYYTNIVAWLLCFVNYFRLCFDLTGWLLNW